MRCGPPNAALGALGAPLATTASPAVITSTWAAPNPGAWGHHLSMVLFPWTPQGCQRIDLF